MASLTASGLITGNVDGTLIGDTRVTGTTNSTSKQTGALVVDGGVGIQNDLYVGGNVNIANSTNSSSITSGALIIDGGVGIAKNLNVGGVSTIQGDCNIIGNLIVSGNTDFINVNNFLVDDNKITLNANTIGAPLLDAFFSIDRGDEIDANIKWNENQDQWEIPNFPVVTESTISVNDTQESSSSTNGALVVVGGVGVGGNINTGGNVNIDSTVQSTGITSGALVVDGGIGVAKNIHIGGNIHGNLFGSILTTIQNNITTMTDLITVGTSGVDTTFYGPIIASESVTGNVTGDLTGNVTGNITGDLTGNVTGDLTGNVTGDLTGDVTGNITGDLTGNVTGDLTGNVTGDLTGDVIGNVTGDVTGNVTGDLTGAVTGDLTGNVTGNVTGDLTGDVIGNVTGDLTGDVTGNVTGDLTGDVTGNVTGDVTGNVTGDLTGDVTGGLTGNVTGDLTGDVIGNVTGDVTGNVTGDLTGDVTGNVTGDVTGDLTGNVTGNVTGDLTGDVIGNVTGDLTGAVTGNVTGDLTGDVIGNVTGDLTGDVTGNVTGDVTGNVTGDVIGDVTGDLTGDVTGNVTGNTFIFGTAESTNTTSGALIVDGGVGIAKNLNIGGTATIQGNCNVVGNFTVLGNTDLLNVTDLLVDDNKIILNANTSGEPILDAFLTVDRGDETDANIKWNEDQNQWEIPNFPFVTEKLGVNGEIKANTVIVANTDESTSTTIGALVVGGGVGISKNVHIGGSLTLNSDEIRLGSSAGQTNQGTRAVAVGGASGVTNQGSYSVAVGWASGYSNQGNDSVAIGRDAGNTSQGTNSIAIGKDAGKISQSDNTICLNATGSTVAANTNTDACYIAPIREDTSGNGQVLYYDNTTKEVHQSDVGFSLVNGNAVVDSDMAITSTTNSTTTTNGALTVAGGVGIATNLNVGNAIFNSTGTLVLKGGATGGSGATYRLESGGNSYIDSTTMTFRNQAGTTNFAQINSSYNWLSRDVLRVGVDSGSQPKIYLGGGNELDGQVWGYTEISSRTYESNSEKTELFLGKFNDVSSSGPDRIRLKAAEIGFDVYSQITAIGNYDDNRVLTVNSSNITLASNKNLLMSGNGRIGIKTPSPACALDIVGDGNEDSSQSTVSTVRFGKYFSRENSLTSLGSNTNFRYSIRCTNGVWINSDSENGGENAFVSGNFVSGNSDKRIKKDIEDMDETECLDKIRSIQPVSYRYNFAADESRKSLGFLAQDVESLVPQSVNKVDRVIDNVAKYGTIEGNIITTSEPHGLEEISTSTGKIRIHLRETETKEKEYSALNYTIIDDCKISVEGIDITPWSNEVYVYGCEVSDFRILDPIPILITALSAMKKMDKTITELQEKVRDLENKIG